MFSLWLIFLLKKKIGKIKFIVKNSKSFDILKL